MEAKKYLYAAVGAPVAMTKSAQEKLTSIQERLSEKREATRKEAQRLIEAWAGEGEKVVERVTDTKTIDELASKVDFDQVQTQVSKLRDQLEDMLATWRTNFSPRADEVTTAPKAEPAAKKPAPKPAAKKPAAKAAAKKPAAKTTTAKAPAAKKPAAKKPAAEAKQTPVEQAPVEQAETKAS